MMALYEDNISIRLANSVKTVSNMMKSNASCTDVSSAVVQCAVTILPGAHAIVVEVHAELSIATVFASANAPFVEAGQELTLKNDSLIYRALHEPFMVHHEPCSDSNQLCPTYAGFPSEADEVLSAKAVPRSDGHSIVLALITEPESTADAKNVLMTLSELLVALCAGRDASILHSKGLLDIARAKKEWERTVDALPEVVCLVDQDGRIVRANRTTERWKLGDVSKLRGLHVHSLFHPDCVSKTCPLRDAVSLCMAAQSSNGYLESAISDSVLGRTLIVHTRLMSDLPIEASENSYPCAVVVVSDISALNRAQQELSRLNLELEERVSKRTSELESANRDLAQEIARRSEAEKALQQSRDELAELSQQLINAQEDERRRLSRELHDSLGQSLGAIKYSLERVMAMFDSPEHGSPASEMGGIVDSVGRLIRETRSMAISLRPPLLDDIGTASAIGWLCQHFADTFREIKFHIDIDVPNADIPDYLATPVYRIVQEALNNVVKHAAASTVMVALHLDDSVLVLEILDDGVGFDTGEENTGSFRQLGKMGRLGMRERALHTNGQLNIESWPGEGTRVTGEWELRNAPKTTE
ncbi:MAG: histidine kinase [Gammaproteobacteria bacterium]|nr:histidine kinase [Gammaproteobacteria bacterium]